RASPPPHHPRPRRGGREGGPGRAQPGGRRRRRADPRPAPQGAAARAGPRLNDRRPVIARKPPCDRPRLGVRVDCASRADPASERSRSMKLPRSAIAVSLALLASAVLASAASALEVGQKAPDFTLNGTDGKPVKLSDLTAKGPVVIYTFIAAFTGT